MTTTLFAALLVVGAPPPDSAIFRYDVAEQTVSVELLNPEAIGTLLSDLAMSPDGRHLAFHVDRGSRNHTLYELTLDGQAGSVTKVTSLGAGREPSYSPDGESLLFGSSPQRGAPSSAYGIMVRNRATGDIEKLIGGGRPVAFPGGFVLAAGTPLGRRPALYKTESETYTDINNLWDDRQHYGWAGRSRGRMLVVTEPSAVPKPVTNEHREARRLEFIMTGDDGDLETEVVFACPPKAFFNWIVVGCDEADDLFFAASQRPGPKHEIWHVTPGPNRTARPILRGWPDVRFHSLAASPDGRRLYFTSNLLEVLGPDGAFLTESDLVVEDAEAVPAGLSGQ